MNIKCLILGHKYSETADRKFRGQMYNRYEFDCQRKNCNKKLSIKEKADEYGFPS